jgi:hypothetical protein
MLGVLGTAGAAICLAPCGSALFEWNPGTVIRRLFAMSRFPAEKSPIHSPAVSRSSFPRSLVYRPVQTVSIVRSIARTGIFDRPPYLLARIHLHSENIDFRRVDEAKRKAHRVHEQRRKKQDVLRNR